MRAGEIGQPGRRVRKSPVAIAAVGLLVIALLALLAQQRAKRPNVTISGVTLGMTEADYRAATSLRRFEIAKVMGTPRANFVNGTLSRFDWHFSNHQYPQVRNAILADYPQLKCQRVKAAAQEVCSLGNTLVISQGQGPGWTSMVLLQ